MLKFRTYLLVFLLLGAALKLFGQQEPIVGWYLPAMMAAKKPKPKTSSDPLVIPFFRSGNLMMVEATVDGQTGYFIFDTGAPYLVLNRTYFRDYPSIANYTALGISNFEVDIVRTEVDSLNIRGLYFADIEADVADLGQIENARKLKILGLLGTNLFKDFVVGIDFEAQNITLYSPQRFKQMNTSKGMAVLPFALKNDVVLLSGRINDKRVSLVFDTGAEINVLDNDLDEEVYESFLIQKRSNLTGAVGETIEVYSGVLLRMTIDNLVFLNMNTLMTNLSGIGKVYGFQVDGIVGYEFLAKGPIFINFNSKEILIQQKDFYD